MCGLAGFASADPALPADLRRAEAMISRLEHRGPDGGGSQALPGCALSHRRLAIIDLSTRASQPMANEDESIWIAFNGEIYNHVELRRDLRERHRFRSESDTEVILHLYEDHGLEALQFLRGFFAFALWDARRGRLILARDRMGKKPLHYALLPEGIAFASEIPALLSGGVEPVLDPAGLATYLCLGYVPAPATALRGIRRLEAGSYLVYESGRVSMHRYWEPPRPGAPAGEEPDFPALLEESVRLRLRSDVPLGVFLSAGLDSTLVAALAARLSSERLRTFTVVFKESGYDESAAARETAAHLGTDHHEISVEPAAAETLPALLRITGEPFADSSLIAVNHLARAVRSEVKVALSGDGGDELFLGYDRYRAHRLAERWRGFPGAARLAARGALAAWPGPRGRRNLAGRAERFVEGASRDPLESNDRWICRFLPSDLGQILAGDFHARLPEDPLEPVHRLYAECGDHPPLDAIVHADLRLWLPEDVLRKVDAASMACSLEVRSPLLDHEVARGAARIPAADRMPGSRGKAILRGVAARLLPRKLLRRPKAGFGLPVDRWLRAGPLRELCRDALLSGSPATSGLLRREAVEGLVRRHESGESNHDEAIWTLLVLEIFLREHKVALP